jgi:hypothetical protein
MSELQPGQARISYPDPTIDDQVVPASAVPHWERVGWSFVEGDREDLPASYQRFEGQPPIRIYHPGLDRYEIVAESAVAQHRSQGWQLASDAEAAGFDGKTVEQLREIAREQGISPLPAKKAELIEALTGGQQDQDQDQDQDQAGNKPAQDSEEGEQ